MIVKRANVGAISDDFRLGWQTSPERDQDITPNRVTSFNVP